uniref:Uncharacterized protein n=1 Tax=Nelumbo nucifera TaxID=4432 RepID=A0A822YK72_NELNU|nr:TPA_asm: hypothetical protein HUJ06_010157 [Nelumbo nucifera]
MVGILMECYFPYIHSCKIVRFCFYYELDAWNNNYCIQLILSHLFTSHFFPSSFASFFFLFLDFTSWVNGMYIDKRIISKAMEFFSSRASFSLFECLDLDHKFDYSENLKTPKLWEKST